MQVFKSLRGFPLFSSPQYASREPEVLFCCNLYVLIGAANYCDLSPEPFNKSALICCDKTVLFCLFTSLLKNPAFEGLRGLRQSEGISVNGFFNPSL